MTQAPGYRARPTHRIVEVGLAERMEVGLGGEAIAASSDVIALDEDRHPRRHYFPRADVRMERLERSRTTTHCPFKGTASYFHLRIGDRTLPDAVWSYEDPYDEHRALKERLAFYDDRYPELQARPVTR